ncbi:hypothetical protein Selli2_30090 [Sellimonas catena]|uniref:Uncharacterized protein n=1 Tax=Sellimonas catena TaxID=2994035 RepID=A0A9W6FIX9_9FIRM|nr:hypothetical protein Selli2_30090 [Sellimonas catena]
MPPPERKQACKYAGFRYQPGNDRAEHLIEIINKQTLLWITTGDRSYIGDRAYIPYKI